MIDHAIQTVHLLKIFKKLAIGSLTILLSSCTNLKAPKTLFITFAVDQREFRDERTRVRAIIDKYTEAFQRSNPETRIVYITYTSGEFFQQIERDSSLDLGPDLVITSQYPAPELLKRDLTTTLPNQQYFDSIYSQRIQSISKESNKYTFAPWIVETQLACFNNTKIETSPSTILELEELSASGKKIGLASNPYELIWTAGTQGAISEISSIGKQNPGKPTYPTIKKWLQWLRKAALYQNIYFLEDYKELTKKLTNNELDWVTCWSSQLEYLKKEMGSSLSTAALPNGSTSKALPTFLVHGFALGKNSSQAQRKTALKFIKTNVNTIAQRKLQLNDAGLLAANQNVFIPPESSKKLSAINTSFNQQSNHYFSEWPGIIRWFVPEERNSKNVGKRYKQLSATLTELTDGYLTINEALKTITTTPTN